MIALRKKFFDLVRTKLFRGNLSEKQVEGIKSIIGAWTQGTDHRWIAYGLATAYHETAQTMQPIEEYGKGRGRAYGVPNGPWHQIYDGRGDVQLTWEYNYKKATVELHNRKVLEPNLDLEKTPDLAMRPDIAAAIMVFGMTEGWFTGRSLANYFNKQTTDWVNARRIINGTDCAVMIAGYAQTFYEALNGETIWVADPTPTKIPVVEAAQKPVDAPKPEAGTILSPTKNEAPAVTLEPPKEPTLVETAANLIKNI